MKRLFYLCLLVGSSFGVLNAQLSTPPSGDNQKTVITQYIGSLVHVTITYNSPDVTSPQGDDRTGQIWGQLVPYGLTDLGFGLRNPAPWRAGANENTTIEFSHDVLVEGEPLEAGKYGFHIIVRENKPWTLIFSNSHSSWGSYFYRPEDDALRVDVNVTESPHQEWLNYEFIDRQPDHTVCALQWEKISVPFKIEVPNIHDLYISEFQNELEGTLNGFNWVSWNTAARYCLNNSTHLEKGLEWAETAINAPFFGEENFATLSTKAQLLTALDRQEESEKVMERAIKHCTTNPFQIHSYGRQLIANDRLEKALEVMKYNYEDNEGAWPTHVGMARIYSAMGKYDKAIKHAEKALEQAPDELNKNNLTSAIEGLKEGKDMN